MEPRAGRTPRGVTLIESLTVMAVAAVLASAAAPSFERLLRTQRLAAAAGLLETDLHHARSLAVARQTALRMEWRQGAAGACYVVHTGRAGDCRCEDGVETVCRPGVTALRSVRLAEPGGWSVRASAAAVSFDPVLGAVTPATSVDLSDAQGRGVRLVVNAMGRVRACSTGETLSGWPSC